MSKVAIIGGGASGLMAAIFAAKNHNDVILLERNSKCGKKILLTGNGRCNYWNSDINVKHYNGSDLDLLEILLSHENQEKINLLFEKIGIVPQIKNGYYYPMSNQANSIRNALVNQAYVLGVDIKNDILVEYINYLDNQFVLNTNNGVITCDKVIIATGSKAQPKTGSDGMGYNFLKKFGHEVVKPLPALVQLIGKGTYFKEWAGVRSTAILSLYENDKKIKQEAGEVQLTDYGISGVCSFQLSGLIARGLDEQKKEQVFINFMPWLEEDLDIYMEGQNGDFTIEQILEGSINYKLIKLILKISNIKESMKWEELDLEKKQLLENNLTNFKIDIIGTKGFDNCQVCSGGIPLEEIDFNTMESNYQKGLYIVGELLNVDGECGGFNLAFAFLTGMIAGSSVSND